MSFSRSFLVLGAGAWGSALAIHLARQPHHVVLWGHDAARIEALKVERINSRYLPDIIFPPQVQFSSDLKTAVELAGADATVLVVVPSVAFEATLMAVHPFLSKNTGIVWATKGLSEQGEFLDKVAERCCPHYPLAVLSGPSFALEVARGLPTAVSIASHSVEFSKYLLETFHSEYFRVYLSSDLVGVQLGGVVKNILAIAVGMSDGLGFGANARAALITRGLAEMSRLAQTLGAKVSTLMGLAGIGDMVLTCTDNQSRNRRFGLALGQSQSIEAAEKQIGQVVEGKMNAKQLIALAHQQQVEMPICQQVYEVLYQGLLPKQAVSNLLNRVPKEEKFKF